MPIWVDADACPVPIREILCRAATRWQIQTTFIANHAISLPPSPHISRRQVPHGFDVADNEIMDQMSKGDLVITQDIPLAAEAIEKGADVFNPRGLHQRKHPPAPCHAQLHGRNAQRRPGNRRAGPIQPGRSKRVCRPTGPVAAKKRPQVKMILF